MGILRQSLYLFPILETKFEILELTIRKKMAAKFVLSFALIVSLSALANGLYLEDLDHASEKYSAEFNSLLPESDVEDDSGNRKKRDAEGGEGAEIAKGDAEGDADGDAEGDAEGDYEEEGDEDYEEFGDYDAGAMTLKESDVDDDEEYLDEDEEKLDGPWPIPAYGDPVFELEEPAGAGAAPRAAEAPPAAEAPRA